MKEFGRFDYNLPSIRKTQILYKAAFRFGQRQIQLVLRKTMSDE